MKTVLFFITALAAFAAEVPAGARATLRAVGDGMPRPTLQWFKDGVALPVGANHVIASASSKDNGSYVCRGDNGYGSAVSEPIVVVVGVAPKIVTPLSNVEVVKGKDTSLSVVAEGIGLRYQWAKRGSLISGATSPSYAIKKANPSDGAPYTVTVTNPFGSVSATATVTVKNKP